MHPTFQRAMNAPVDTRVLVALCDWRLFFRYCQDRGHRQVFTDLDEFYRLTEDVVEAAAGHVVKFMGDAALVVFPEELADTGIMALLALKQRTDTWFRSKRIDSLLHVNAHFGEVTLGCMGRAMELDVIGSTVNITATMGSKDFALSQQAFRCLTPEHRRLFRRFTPPILYLPAKPPRLGKLGGDPAKMEA